MAQDLLANILRERQLLADAEIERGLNEASDEHCYLEEVLVRDGAFASTELLEILENHFYCPAFNETELPFDAQLLNAVPKKLVISHLALPIGSEGEAVKLVMANPDDLRAQDMFSYALRRPIVRMVALRDTIQRAIDNHYKKLERETKTTNGNGIKKPSPQPIPVSITTDQAKSSQPKQCFKLEFKDKTAVGIVDQCIEAAAKYGVSDIHVQPQEKELQIRFRLDGILHTVAQLSPDMTPSVTSRIKILGSMDVSERRAPQDGRYTMRKGDLLLDLRISSLPSQFGEKIVLRLLTKDASLMKLENLKMPPAMYQAYQEVITNPQGFYLVTGPTGSGKSTTLYATINALDRERVNVITLEDPIEYQLPNITQVQINEEAGVSFASGLRSILRQDPDVVLVGEIRDRETLEIACRAALTGHKVFSTIHTNDTCQVVTRLTDMGTPPFLITATLKGVLAQRLARTICKHCKETYQANDTEQMILGYPKNKELHRGKGCEKCNWTGYKGRVAIYEYLRIEDNLHRLILDRASPYTIRHAAQRNGMVTMAEYAKRAVLAGTTTVEEIQRAVLSEEGQEQVCQNCMRVVNSEFVVCPFCQQMLKEKCEVCQNPVEADWEACPCCGHEITREWRQAHCGRCLAPVSATAESCPYCGGDVA